MLKNNMLNEAINKYIKDNISPKEGERNTVSRRYEELTGMLKGPNIQSGSFARFTAVTPVNDLDVIWELPQEILAMKLSEREIATKTIDPKGLDVSNILEDLAKELKKEYAKKSIPVMKIIPRSHSVGIFFGPTEDDFSIDVVPAVPAGTNEYGENTYWVPEIAEKSKFDRNAYYLSEVEIKWIKSDPRGYIKEATKLNDKNQAYRHVVKFCKKWKWALKGRYPSIKFKSFHIEMAVKSIFVREPNLDIVSGIKKFYGEIRSFLAAPQIKDRANNGKYIDEYLHDMTQETKNIIANAGAKVVISLNALEAEADSSAVQRGLANIFVIAQAVGTPTVAPSFAAKPASRPYYGNHDC